MPETPSTMNPSMIAVCDLLSTGHGATVVELAERGGLGRSTVAKVLGGLEARNLARRQAAERTAGRRVPDLWFAPTPDETAQSDSATSADDAPGADADGEIETGEFGDSTTMAEAKHAQQPEGEAGLDDRPGPGCPDAEPADETQPNPAPCLGSGSDQESGDEVDGRTDCVDLDPAIIMAPHADDSSTNISTNCEHTDGTDPGQEQLPEPEPDDAQGSASVQCDPELLSETMGEQTAQQGETEAAPEHAMPSASAVGLEAAAHGAALTAGLCADASARSSAASAANTVKGDPTSSTRLSKGELRALVVEHLVAHPEEQFTAPKLSKVLGRSSGAISNVFDALVKSGEAQMTCEKPRTFRHHGAAGR